MICDREEEISAFIPEEYWSLDAMLKAPGTKKPAAAHFHKDKDGKTEIRSRAELDALLESLKGQKFIVNDIRNGERTKKPPLPFTTSTMQQEASKALNFSTQKTMRLAQANSSLRTMGKHICQRERIQRRITERSRMRTRRSVRRIFL